jgi:hypothetical protein
LWNLSDLSDASGNGRALINKGAVPFTTGINGLANTAARFSGVVGQGLYIADSGAADPFRIKTGSFGCWFRCAKRSTQQVLMSKFNGVPAANAWILQLIGNTPSCTLYLDGVGTAAGCAGITDVIDDRWHFVCITYDGSAAKMYVDGILEGFGVGNGMLNSGASPMNLGTYGADAANAGGLPLFGRMDEVFVTNDILTEDQIRNLYCAKIPHALGIRPTRASVNVIRRRRGAALVAGDFPVQPLRLHNFSAGSLGDAGSNNVALTNNGGAVAVTGADGTKDNAFAFTGTQTLSATDAGLPNAFTARSYGCWFKTSAAASQRHDAELGCSGHQRCEGVHRFVGAHQ